MACGKHLVPNANFCILFQHRTCSTRFSAVLRKFRMQRLASQSGRVTHRHVADGRHHGCMQVSQDEEKLQKARLEVKRGLPLQDLSGNKGFPEDARMQAQVRRPKGRLKSLEEMHTETSARDPSQHLRMPLYFLPLFFFCRL